MEPPSSEFVRGGKWKEIERDISITGEEDAHRLLTMQEEDSGSDGDEVVGREEEEQLYSDGDDGEGGEEGDSGEGARCVHVNDRAANAAAAFATNMTSTTKYTWWNFPFKNLYEQFRRVANSYFLLVMIIQLIPGVAPITPLTSILPLLFVLCVTAIKDAWDDWNRRKADNEVNNRTAVVSERDFVRGSLTWRNVAYKDIVVGDLIRIHDGEEFPADIVFIKSAAADHQCFIETSDLDGETTKKIKRALAFTSTMTEAELANIEAVVECDAPNIHLDSFNGKFTLKASRSRTRQYTLTSKERRKSLLGRPLDDDLPFPLNETQLLPRGARLVNTPFIIGVVVYTGRDTKLVLNQQPVPLKFSYVERTTNKLLIALVAFILTLCLITAVLSVYWRADVGSRIPYLMMPNDISDDFKMGAKNFLTLFVLFNTFVPISLYVTIEFIKLLQSYFLANDLDLYDVETDQPVIVKTTSLLEDLGQVDYVFSDKTGTLTENKLVLKKCSIRGTMYDASGPSSRHVAKKAEKEEEEGKAWQADGGRGKEEEEGENRETLNVHDDDAFPLEEDEARLEDDLSQAEVEEFLLALALCHSAFVESAPQDAGGGHQEPGGGLLTYQASSPDDEALVLAAAQYGVTLTSRVGDRLTVRMRGQDHVFHVLAELPFDSDRKRMSVIVRTPSNEIRIYCKGAETVVLPRLKYYTPDAVGKLQDKLSAAESDYIAQTEQHINHYARKGLRTLLVSMATMDQTQFDRWLYVYQKAAIAVHHRKDKVARAAELIERDLLLLGATAIEDKLQHGVPETLRDLARAGIKVWVLTGDKQETAINIGYSAHVLDETMELLCVNTSTTQACQHTLDSSLARLQAAGPTKKCALIIDGLSLGFALEDHKVQFRELSKLCQSVICCRVSAKQKAAVVSLIKAEGHTTLAIGDGANDVSMIRSAHVGIGIIGKEGSQASRSSDYAIAQFRFLKKLLLVHGRYSYLRISTLIQYYFYKNATFTLPQFYFSFFNGFSGQTLFDSWIIVLFNIVFTSLPVLLVGLWDRDVPQEALLQFPSLYSRSRLNKEFNFKARSALSFLYHLTFFWWLGSAVLHSALIFFFALVISTAVLPNGHPMDMFLFGITVSTSAITIVTLKLALETNTWTVFHHLVFWGSLGVYFFFISIYGLIPHVRGWDNHIYWAFFTLFTSSSFWLTYLALVVCSLLPDLTFKSVLRCFFPSDWSVMREYWLRARLRQRTAAYYGFLSASTNTQGGDDETKPLVGSHRDATAY